MGKELTISKVINQIINFETIIILRHINPDGDAFGSQLGLKKLIKLNWPTKNVYAVGSKVRFFETLGVMDNVDDIMFKNALVIITDTGTTARIDDDRWKFGKKVIKIDHHPNEEGYGDLEWVDDSFTSASEMIAWMAYQSNLKIDESTAKTILFGITTDSNRFFARNTTARTFTACSYLMSPNWNITTLFQEIYQTKASFLYAEAEIINNMQIANGVGALFLTQEIMIKYDIPYDQNDMFTNLLQGVSELEIWVVFSANENGTYRVEFRSKNVPIKAIAEKYHGGGHALIAGATIADLSIANNIIADLEKLLKVEKE